MYELGKNIIAEGKRRRNARLALPLQTGPHASPAECACKSMLWIILLSLTMSRTMRILIMQCEICRIGKLQEKSSRVQALLLRCAVALSPQGNRRCISNAPILIAPPISIVGMGVCSDFNRILSKTSNLRTGIR